MVTMMNFEYVMELGSAVSGQLDIMTTEEGIRGYSDTKPVLFLRFITLKDLIGVDWKLASDYLDMSVRKISKDLAEIDRSEFDCKEYDIFMKSYRKFIASAILKEMRKRDMISYKDVASLLDSIT